MRSIPLCPPHPPSSPFPTCTHKADSTVRAVRTRWRTRLCSLTERMRTAERTVEEYVWDDSEGHGLGGKQYGATVTQCWGTACSVASTVSGYSWAIGTTYVG